MTLDQFDKVAKALNDYHSDGQGYEVTVCCKSGAAHTGSWYTRDGSLVRLDVAMGLGKDTKPIFIDIYEIESVELA